MSRARLKQGIRHQLRTMQVGETILISREDMRPTSVRATCTQLKGDEGATYTVKGVSAGCEVRRIS